MSAMWKGRPHTMKHHCIIIDKNAYYHHYHLGLLDLHLVLHLRLNITRARIVEKTSSRFIVTLIARFMVPTWGPSGADRTQVGPYWPYELCYMGSFSSYVLWDPGFLCAHRMNHSDRGYLLNRHKLDDITAPKGVYPSTGAILIT